MSLLKRVESAKRGPGDPNDRAMVPVAPKQPAQTKGPGRGEQIGDIRLRLQREVIASFTDLIDAKPEEVTAKIEGIVDRVITEGDLAITREERQKLVDQMLHDVTGFGPIEPFLKDETITEVMVNGPNQIYIERAGKLERVEASFLNDQHVRQVIDRIITPIGRRIDEMSPRVWAGCAGATGTMARSFGSPGPLFADSTRFSSDIRGGLPSTGGQHTSPPAARALQQHGLVAFAQRSGNVRHGPESRPVTGTRRRAITGRLIDRPASPRSWQTAAEPQ